MKAVLVIFILAVLHFGLNQAHIDESSQTLQRHKRAWIIDSYEIEEERAPRYFLGKIEIERKQNVRYKLSGMGIDKEPKNVIKIDENTGEIYVLKKVDREQYQSLTLTFLAVDTIGGVLDTQLGVSIKIKDINDNVPTFDHQIYTTTVKESQVQGGQLILVRAEDKDERNTPNSTFTYKIVSQTPMTDNALFYIDQAGIISFRGCIDYEKAQKYTIVVEAKDQGEKVQLSSSTTVIVDVEDGNNHLPVQEGVQLVANVKERDSNVTLLRIKVSDRDKPHTPGWKAKYTIVSGNENNSYKILTDPDTNDGVLTLVKPLDFEDGYLRELSVQVENETPFFSCSVKRVVADDLWEVDYSDPEAGSTGIGFKPKNLTVIVNVEDINDAPDFVPPIKVVYLEENDKIGKELQTFTAIDKDGSLSSEFRYTVGVDPAGWVSIDPKMGTVITTQLMDRESPFVINNTYTVILHAVDNGKPPMTGSGTLVIHLTDVNDCIPYLLTPHIDMCANETASMTKLAAQDDDEDPYSGPFSFNLLEKESLKGKWRLDPTHGYSVNLIKEENVYSGIYILHLEISDRQGVSSKHNLTVTVCDCPTSAPANCGTRRLSSVTMEASAVGILFAALFLMLGLFCFALFFSRAPKTMEIYDDGDCTMLPYHLEHPGSDCKLDQLVSKEPAEMIQNESRAQEQESIAGYPISNGSSRLVKLYYSAGHDQQRTDGSSMHMLNVDRRGRWKQQSVSNSMGYQFAPQTLSTMNRTTSARSSFTWKKTNAFNRNGVLSCAISQRVDSLHSGRDDLLEYNPHPYADEGEEPEMLPLDAISIPDSEFTPDQLLDLGPRFKTLASIVRADWAG
ncbi:cadherin-like protein 26 isoform X1 [Acipenser ruthenus]|uniref:cadherin-like protein 26 isoform X1 n=1 Tax=Acipenser ruthenus TaxID=7906 RepID=UPI0027424F12|nr:cadherin-like protein 26 isoform X1 [Acipenser ruthenus]